MNKRKSGLGRGLETLLGKAEPQGGQEALVPSVLPLSSLQSGKYQPRTRMDEGALGELAESIRVQGIMQPVLVRSVGGERYEIIAGERRVRAATIAGLTEIPVLVRDVPDEAAAAMALIENIQREDLNPLEEAQGVQRLISEFHLTHEDAAAAIGRSRSATSNLLRLLNLARPVQNLLMAGDIDMGHARALLAVDAATQIVLSNQVVAKRLSVRDTERLVGRSNAASDGVAHPRSAKRERPDADVAGLETELSDLFATRVTVRVRGKGRGQLSIDFGSLEQLDGLLDALRGKAL